MSSDTHLSDATHGSGSDPGSTDTALPVSSRDRYLVERELGRGAQSVVYVARDSAVGREVALKTLRTPEADLRFVREARITGQLEHPGIVPVYEMGRDADGRVYCTQRLVRGRTLREAFEACRSAADRMALLGHFVDLCNAVAYAHSRGVVHRDLKPENVMVGEFGETVVLDWGVARVLGGRETDIGRAVETSDVAQTQHGALIGTPLYMSPEQARGARDEIDARSDVWALGVMLYELVAGVRPFDAPDVHSLLAKVREGRATPVQQAFPDVPAELVAVVNQALQPAPGDRFADARKLALEVGAFRDGARVSVYRYSSLELLRRFVRKNRLLSASLAALVLTLAIATPVSLLARAQAQRNLAEALTQQAHIAENDLDFGGALELHRRAHAASPSEATRLAIRLLEPLAPSATPGPKLSAVAARYVRLSRDGHRAVLRFDTDATLVEGEREIGRWPIENGVPAISPEGRYVALPGRPARLVEPGAEHALGEVAEAQTFAFSGDGALLAAAAPAGVVHLYRVEPFEHLRTFAEPLLGLDAMTLDAAGARLAAADKTGNLVLWDAATGARTGEFRLRTRPLADMAFTPDGKRLVTGDDERYVDAWDLATGRLVASHPLHTRPIGSVTVSPDGTLLAATSADATVSISALEDLRPLGRLIGDSWIWSLAFPGPGVARVVDERGRTVDWNLEPLLRHPSISNAPAMVFALAFSPDGDRTVWGTAEGELGLHTGNLDWRAEKGSPVYSATFDPTGRKVVVNRKQGVTLFDVTDQRLTVAQELATSCSIARHSAFTPTGALLLACEKTVQLWEGSKKVEDVASEEARVRMIAVTADGKRWAWIADDVVVVYEPETKRLTRQRGREIYRAVAFSPDGRTLAVSGQTSAELRAADTLALRKTLAGHTGVVFDVAFSPDGRLVATGSGDRSVRLWDATTGEYLVSLPPRHFEVTALDWSPQGDEIAVGDSKGTITFAPIGR